MKTHGSINLIIKEVTENYTHDRMKQRLLRIIFCFFSLKAESS
jgi:hypothetical protein